MTFPPALPTLGTALPAESAAAPASGQALLAQQARLASTLVQRQFDLHPEFAVRYGASGRVKALEDANYHLSFLVQALQAGRPEMFGDYIAWAKVMLARRGVQAEDLAEHLRLMRELLLELLPPDAGAAAAAVVDHGLASFPQMPMVVPSFLDPAAPLAALARDHLALLLRGDRGTAGQRILAAVAAGTPIRLVYMEVFQRTQREIGRLWQMNEISVAQEHYCTAATQLIMSQLYPHIFAGPKHAGTLVATCVAGDLHEIGVRMLADLFEMAGWNAYYLGANTPSSAVLQTLHERQAQVLAVSATLGFHVAAVQDLIASVRADERFAHIKVLVGGYPFNLTPGLWQQIGADGHASTADEAISLAQSWVGPPNRPNAP